MSTSPDKNRFPIRVKSSANASFRTWRVVVLVVPVVEAEEEFFARKPMKTMDVVRVWTDGSCLGNPGPGGWAAVTETGECFTGGDRHTTNNRMELMGAIAALEWAVAVSRPVVVYSDSQYLCKNAMGIGKWASNGWRTAAGTPVKNADLWKWIMGLISEQVRNGNGSSSKFEWVKGHSGCPENELVDRLARGVADNYSLPADSRATVSTLAIAAGE